MKHKRIYDFPIKRSLLNRPIIRELTTVERFNIIVDSIKHPVMFFTQDYLLVGADHGVVAYIIPWCFAKENDDTD